MSEPPTHPKYEERAFILYEASGNANVEYLRHPSGVIIVRLGEKHPCLSNEIQDVTFDTSKKKGGGNDRTKQTVIGKGKKGGLKMMPETKLCIVKCTDGSNHIIRCGIKATLIEANARLVENPQLLKTSRTYAGFIAIVIPPSVLNHHRNTIPEEFDKIVRVGTEIPYNTRLLASKHLEDEAEAENEEEIQSKRQKLDLLE
jgi:hypothetical protein